MRVRDPNNFEKLFKKFIKLNPKFQEGQFYINLVEKTFFEKSFQENTKPNSIDGGFNHPASLNYIDENGSSFLSYALDLGAWEISTLLLDRLSNDDEIIFAIDNKGRNLFWYAANQGYIEITKKLILILKERNAIKPNYKLALPDHDGCTPLHAAAKKGAANHDIVLQLLLEEVIKDIDKDKILRHLDRDGDTILHHALRKLSAETIAKLIEAGCDLSIRNNKKTTPGMLFCKQSIARQFEICKFLNDQNKEKIYNLYHRVLSDDQKIEGITTDNLKLNYYKIAAKNSLSALIVARIQFDSRIQRKNFINNEKNKMLFCVSPQNAVNKDNDCEDARMRIADLIFDIENYLSSVAYKYDESRRITRLTQVFILSYIFVLVYLVSLSLKTPKNISAYDNEGREYNVSHYGAYVASSVFFGFFGCLLIMCCPPFIISRLFGTISRSNWKDLLYRSEYQVLKPLSDWQQLSSDENTSLPTSADNIQKLRDTIDNLRKKRLNVTILKTLLSDLIDSIKKIQGDITLTNKPLSHSLFFKPIIKPEINNDHHVLEIEELKCADLSKEPELDKEFTDEEFLLLDHRGLR